MNEYRHHVSGIFAHREEAESAFSRLIKKGLPKGRIQIFESDSTLPAATQQAKSNKVLKDMVVDGAIGLVGGEVGKGQFVVLAPEDQTNDGAHVYRYRVLDNLGNSSDTGICTVRISTL